MERSLGQLLEDCIYYSSTLPTLFCQLGCSCLCIWFDLFCFGTLVIFSAEAVGTKLFGRLNLVVAQILIQN
ncbi:hypothetical protein VNO77_11153 [Canavalia gladiata]|uniref:Uncharacterized protein n=1 Tax=Canavalia gladiata TaxID=3824 RepID=A0AAN9QY77_CANGL